MADELRYFLLSDGEEVDGRFFSRAPADSGS